MFSNGYSTPSQTIPTWNTPWLTQRSSRSTGTPLGPVTDVVAIGKFVDFFLFVIKWGGTQTQVVQQALNKSQIVGDNLLGVILNKVDFESLADYERSYDNYEGYWTNKCDSTI